MASKVLFSSRGIYPLILLTTGVLFPDYACSQEKNDAILQSMTERILKARGIDPALLTMLDNTERFPAGENLIDISVNGELKGSFNVMISQAGGLCFTPQLFTELGLKQPDSIPISDTACFNWTHSDPAVSIKFNTSNLSASIVVPQHMLVTNWVEGEGGGIGALINYNYFASVNRNRGKQNHYNYLNLEDGFNIQQWMVRSWQQISESEGKVSSDMNSLYAERSFSRWQKRFQIGQISVTNSLFQIGDISGVQLIPDDGFQQNEGGAVVQGIANTPQARVEVYQYGSMIYTTLVPAGPFRLTQIPLKNLNGDLEVKVLETDGREQKFTVPASSIINVNPARNQGFSLAAGKLRHVSRHDGEGIPAILTINKNWRAMLRFNVQNGVLLAEKYQSLAASVGGAISQGMQLAAQIIVANDINHRTRGTRMLMSGGYRINDTLSFSASVSKNTRGYYQITQPAIRDKDKNDNDDTQYTLSASWTTSDMGVFSLGHSELTSFDRNISTTRYDTLGWSIPIKKAFLSMTASRSTGNFKNKQLSVSLSFPLGGQSINNYYRNSRTEQGGTRGRLGSQLNGLLNENSSYVVSTERDMQQHDQSVQGGVNANLHYTNVGLSVGRSGPRASNYSLSGSGSVAMVGSHVLFSPRAVGHTFGMVALSEKLANVSVKTPTGTSWTDWRGMALVPDIPAWQPASFDLDTDTLGKTDVGNSHRSVTLARGAVKRIDYMLLNNRRVLLTLRLSDGTLLPRGSKVLDDKDNFITMAIDEGVIYLDNSPEKATLLIDNAQTKQRCSFSYQLDDPESDNGPYQKISGICQ